MDISAIRFDYNMTQLTDADVSTMIEQQLHTLGVVIGNGQVKGRVSLGIKNILSVSKYVHKNNNSKGSIHNRASRVSPVAQQEVHDVQ